MRLKYTYGINAWKQWVAVKNTELEVAASSGRGAASRPKLFKSEILHCSPEELNLALSLFVKEVRKPMGQTYAADSVYYLCLGIPACRVSTVSHHSSVMSPFCVFASNALTLLVGRQEEHPACKK